MNKILTEAYVTAKHGREINITQLETGNLQQVCYEYYMHIIWTSFSYAYNMNVLYILIGWHILSFQLGIDIFTVLTLILILTTIRPIHTYTDATNQLVGS